MTVKIIPISQEYRDNYDSIFRKVDAPREWEGFHEGFATPEPEEGVSDGAPSMAVAEIYLWRGFPVSKERYEKLQRQADEGFCNLCGGECCE